MMKRLALLLLSFSLIFQSIPSLEALAASTFVDAGPDKTTNVLYTQGATVTDNGFGIAGYLWTADSESVVIDSPTTEDTNISATADGTYILTLTVIFNDGASDADTAVLIWDATAPIVGAGASGFFANSLFTQDATVNGEVSGVKTYLWEQTAGPGAVTFGTPNIEDTTVSADTEGDYTIRLTVEDNAGNITSDTATFTWDTVAPAFVSTTMFPAAWYSSNQTATFTYTDDNGIVSGEPVTCVISTEGTNQTCSVTPNVRDAAGNSNTTTQVSNSINLDKTNPIVDAGVNHATNALFTQNATVSDAISGVTSYTWSATGPGTVTFGTPNTEDTTVSADTDGTYTLTLNVVDNAGNTASDTTTLTWDATAPIVDAGSDHMVNTSFTQDATVDGAISGVKTYLWEQTAGTGAVTFGTPNTEDTTVSADTDGTYTIRLTVEDNAGNITSDTATFTWDVTAPASSVDALPTYKNTATFDVAYTASDSTSGVRDVQLWYRYKATTSETFGAWTKFGTYITSPISFTANDGDGIYEFYSRATDNAGNYEAAPTTADATTTVVDTTDPTSTITVPSNSGNGSTVFSNSWDGVISGTADDALSGVNHVLLSIQRRSDSKYWNGETWGEETTVTVDGATAWTYSLSPFAEDIYDITSYAVDNAGNTETSYSIVLVYDITKPTVSFSIDPATPDASNNWYNTDPEITLTATDNNDPDYGVARIEYQWITSDSAWTTYTGKFHASNESARILYFRSIDKSGNISDLGSREIKFDKTSPSKGPQNVSVNPNPSNGSNIKVTWDRAEDNVAIDYYRIEWWKDGVDRRSDTVSSNVFEFVIPTTLSEGIWEVAVTAYDPAGHSASGTAKATVDKTGPTAPKLSILSTGTEKVTLGWTKIDEATDYSVWYGRKSGDYTYAAHVGNITSYTVSHLGNGTYYFVVAAYDTTGNRGPYSNEVHTGTASSGIIDAFEEPADGFKPAGEVYGASQNPSFGEPTGDLSIPTARPTSSISTTGDETKKKINWAMYLFIGVGAALLWWAWQQRNK